MEILDDDYIINKKFTSGSNKEEQPTTVQAPQYQQVDIGTVNTNSSSPSFAESVKQGKGLVAPQTEEQFTTTEGNITTPMDTAQQQEWKGIGYTSAHVDMGNISANDKSFLASLGKVESSNNYYARPNSSGYEGKYQFRFRKGDDGTKYLSRLGITREQWRKSPQLQEKMMRTVLKDYDSQLKSKGIPVNNWTRWLRHNQGLGGAKAMLRGKLSRVIRRNIRNQGVKGSTDAELIANYTKKFKRRFN
jgi:hypothetical protein